MRRVGLFSAGVIVFMLGMGVFFVRFFLKHIHDDEAAAGKLRPSGPGRRRTA